MLQIGAKPAMRPCRLIGVVAAMLIMTCVQPVAGQDGWTIVETPITITPDLIQFVSSTHGFAKAGRNFSKYLLRTTDGGESWTRTRIPAAGDITMMQFVDEKTGFVGGQDGMLFRTDDAGESWTGTKIYDTWRWLLTMAVVDSSTAFIGGGGGIMLKNTDLHSEWSFWERQDVRGFGWPFYDIHFWNANRGLVVGDKGAVYLTDDAGVSWRKADIEVGTPLLSAVAFADSLMGVAVGATGARCRTIDAGETWDCIEGSSSDTTHLPLWQVEFVTDEIVYALASGDAFLDYLLRSDDAGMTWEKETFGVGDLGGLGVRDGDVYVGAEGGRFFVRSHVQPTAREPEPALRSAMLHGVYPNPTRGAATIEFTMAAPGQAELEVFDLLGRRVAAAASGVLSPGRHHMRWESASHPTGPYIVRLTADHFVDTRTVFVVR